MPYFGKYFLYKDATNLTQFVVYHYNTFFPYFNKNFQNRNYSGKKKNIGNYYLPLTENRV